MWRGVKEYGVGHASHSGCCGDVLVGAPELLRRVHGQPQARVAVRAQRALGGELREDRRLVVALLGEALDRGGGQHVDAAVDPVRHPRHLVEAGHDVVVGEIDLPELRRRLRDGDRRCRPARAMPRQQRREIDVDELVAVHREDVAALVAGSGGEADRASAAEPLGLARARDLDSEAGEALPRTPAPARRSS